MCSFLNYTPDARVWTEPLAVLRLLGRCEAGERDYAGLLGAGQSPWPTGAQPRGTGEGAWGKNAAPQRLLSSSDCVPAVKVLSRYTPMRLHQPGLPVNGDKFGLISWLPGHGTIGIW